MAPSDNITTYLIKSTLQTASCRRARISFIHHIGPSVPWQRAADLAALDYTSKAPQYTL
jgi:hypothetical protein